MLNQLLRYEPVVRLIRSGPGRQVLEVGSGSRGLGRYLGPEWRVTACDVSFDDYGADRIGQADTTSRVVGSVLDLPFADQSYETVVALDLLEHLQPSDRPRALAELARVAARTLVVGCPCGPAAEEVDRRLVAWYRLLRRPLPGWLVEHQAFATPSVEELTEPLQGRGRLVTCRNASAGSQLAVLALEALPLMGRVSVFLSALLERRLRDDRASRTIMRFLRGRDRAPAYRVIATLRIG